MSIWLNCQGVWCYTGRSWANKRSCFISVMSCLSWTWLYIISISSVTCSRSPVIWYRSLTDWASPLSFSQPRIYTLAVVSFEKTGEQWGKMVKYNNQGPILLFATQLGLSRGFILIWVYFYLVQKQFFGSLSLYLFPALNHQNLIVQNKKEFF